MNRFQIMITANILAVGLVGWFRAAPIGLRLRRAMGRSPEAGSLRAEDLLQGGGVYTVIVRAAGVLLSLVGLVAMWVTIHAAMAPGGGAVKRAPQSAISSPARG